MYTCSISCTFFCTLRRIHPKHCTRDRLLYSLTIYTAPTRISHYTLRLCRQVETFARRNEPYGVNAESSVVAGEHENATKTRRILRMRKFIHRNITFYFTSSCFKMRERLISIAGTVMFKASASYSYIKTV